MRIEITSLDGDDLLIGGRDAGRDVSEFAAAFQDISRRVQQHVGAFCFLTIAIIKQGV